MAPTTTTNRPTIHGWTSVQTYGKPGWTGLCTCGWESRKRFAASADAEAYAKAHNLRAHP